MIYFEKIEKVVRRKKIKKFVREIKIVRVGEKKLGLIIKTLRILILILIRNGPNICMVLIVKRKSLIKPL